MPQTGIAAVDAVLDAVAGSAGAPPAQQAAVFAEAHERLRRALDDLDAFDAPPA